MRKLFVLFSAILVATVAGQAGAKTLGWHGTLDLDLGALPSVRILDSGVATVNNSSGGDHLSTLRLAGGITGSGTAFVTDPDTTAQIPSIRIAADLGTGTITGISGAPPLGANKLKVDGLARVCLVFSNCNTALSLDLATPGSNGVGAGGLLTLGGNGAIKISIVAAPWTLGTVSGVNQTADGNFATLSRVGFVHGANSSPSTTATGSGVIQLISPANVVSIVYRVDSFLYVIDDAGTGIFGSPTQLYIGSYTPSFYEGFAIGDDGTGRHAPGAEDGNLRRHDDKCGVPPAQGTEI